MPFRKLFPPFTLTEGHLVKSVFMCQECDTRHNCICAILVQKHFVQELSKVDFQDQFVAINFGNISLTVLKKINHRFYGEE